MRQEKSRPIIAVTMGDPAGIGPEIVIKALLDEEIYTIAQPLIIGSINILKKTAEIVGMEVTINKVSTPYEAVFKKGVLNVIEPVEDPCESIQFGVIQAKAGILAYEYIKKAIELGMNKQVNAVATAPINKEALKAAGVNFIGHTEIFAALTNSEYALTMFAVRNLRVFFVSRHLSLRDACNFVTKKTVLKFLVNINKELMRLGIKNPRIAVAALNPHAGDGGLFGREEIEHLHPAIQAAKEMGINAVGPVPADSIFYLGLLGNYDAILSLYHDQGHIACKTLDFERSITITLGLPFIRSSVDHGTAFDIAGKGIASPISMKEAIRLAAEYSLMLQH
ncbi:D-erythronate 4-phosphate dehydrogenase [Moorella thermoacetica]|uniref:4-hydroxythreonine-4-phosphate dehydrogenase 2 n=1 Tax=Neomoorella thermoacetica TaxID=1525 RepID=A0AAC9MTQ9_NEOTH|nr:4-hydroxythreonine-4-phosphate dehydrogenase PdxA [Moorella thermoacetica]AOQ22741.1 4-hydroxythreonine-4-phosphate dehydrogenase 2 [Moorella thermoacetica]TYL06834.1 D-erythronate 4-phosphate dehydrogenase [Moorella thermoacetica]